MKFSLLLCSFGLLICIGSQVGCSSSKPEKNAKSAEPSASNQPAPASSAETGGSARVNPFELTPGIPPDQPECDMDQSPILTTLEGQRMGNGELFPYVYQGVGRTILFEAYSMSFQLCHDPLLVPMTNDRIAWINQEVYNENTGNFITYLRQGRDISMSSPYILVQYIKKSLPMCSTADSIYTWLDQQYLSDPQAEVITPITRIQTAADLTATCKEYQTGTANGQRPKRYLAYAYVDYNEDYFVGFALTTNLETDFPINRPLFYKLVRSLNYF